MAKIGDSGDGPAAGHFIDDEVDEDIGESLLGTLGTHRWKVEMGTKSQPVRLDVIMCRKNQLFLKNGKNARAEFDPNSA